MKKSVRFGVLAIGCFALVACDGLAPKPLLTDPDDQSGGLPTDAPERLSDIPGFSLFGGDSSGQGGLGAVNRHLWRASLDTLAFLPLSTTDPFTGVIATDWASTPDAPEERFKVTAYVRGTALAASALQVAVFREIRDPSGSWTTAAVSGATARQMEDAILVKARQLKIADREAQ